MGKQLVPILFLFLMGGLSVALFVFSVDGNIIENSQNIESSYEESGQKYILINPEEKLPEQAIIITEHSDVEKANKLDNMVNLLSEELEEKK